MNTMHDALFAGVGLTGMFLTIISCGLITPSQLRKKWRYLGDLLLAISIVLITMSYWYYFNKESFQEADYIDSIADDQGVSVNFLTTVSNLISGNPVTILQVQEITSPRNLYAQKLTRAAEILHQPRIRVVKELGKLQGDTVTVTAFTNLFPSLSSKRGMR